MREIGRVIRKGELYTSINGRYFLNIKNPNVPWMGISGLSLNYSRAIIHSSVAKQLIKRELYWRWKNGDWGYIKMSAWERFDSKTDSQTYFCFCFMGLDINAIVIELLGKVTKELRQEKNRETSFELTLVCYLCSSYFLISNSKTIQFYPKPIPSTPMLLPAKKKIRNDSIYSLSVSMKLIKWRKKNMRGLLMFWSWLKIKIKWSRLRCSSNLV